VERSGEETVAIWSEGRRGASPAGLRLLCRDPSGLLGPFFEQLAASVCMSATLDPPDFHQAMLGLSDARRLEARFPSPFPPENRRVLVVPTISTEYRKRERDRAATADLINEVIAAVPGNLAIFFPSFAFKRQIESLIDTGDRPVLVQGRSMGEAARAEVLDTLAKGEGHVFMGVLGGIFAEGIDLPGDGLHAAVIVGPALPQANLARRLLQQWFQERYGHGFRYAWLVPGMSKVVQAAGRVIRTPEDRGAIILLGRRFLQRDYQGLFPEDWVAQRTASPGEALEGFWS